MVSYTALGQKASIKNGQLETATPITFQPNTATLSEEGIKAVQEIKEFLAAKEDITMIRVEGHVMGSEDNQKLSEARAKSVADKLKEVGIDCKRVIAVGFGDTKPVSEIPSSNTRVTVVMVALRGKVIGGMPVNGGGKVASMPCE